MNAGSGKREPAHHTWNDQVPPKALQTEFAKAKTRQKVQLVDYAAEMTLVQLLPIADGLDDTVATLKGPGTISFLEGRWATGHYPDITQVRH